jgi:hypothetical protein
MHCESIKPGVDCTFMTKKGCSFNGGKCRPVVESCEGCDRILDANGDRYCNAFPDPSVKWRRGTCNLATHQKGNGNGAKPEQKVNPLKASKRAARR